MTRVVASCVWFLTLIHYTETMMFNRADMIDCLNGTSSFSSKIIFLSDPSLIIDTRDNVLKGTYNESADAVSDPAVPGFIQQSYGCTMHIKAVPGLQMMIDTAVSKCRETDCLYCVTRLTLTETTEDHSQKELLIRLCHTQSAKHYVYTSPNATVTLWLTIGLGENRFEDFDIFVNLTTFPSSRRILTVKFTDAMKGFVSTPGWDGVTWYWLVMDTWVSLAVPAGHEVMLSVDQLVFDLNMCFRNEFLALHEHPGAKPFTVFCDMRSPALVALNSSTGNVLVHFSISAIWKSKGFKLNFSFHQRFSTRPTDVGDGQWDCGSVANWSEFQQHFPCNFQAECVGGEDEAPCPYTSPRCGAGRVLIGGFCYIYIHPKRIGSRQTWLSWNEAEEICKQEGVQLLSFNSYRAIQDVKDFQPDTPLFIRLVNTQSSAPLL